MQSNNYPVHVCSECSYAHGGKYIEGHIGSFFQSLCDVCNEWKSVTSPSDFGFPKFTTKRDFDKIFYELIITIHNFWKNNDFNSAIEVIYLLEGIFHERLEELEGKNESTIILRRDKRRKAREGNRKTT